MIRKQPVRGKDEVRVTFVLPGDHSHGAVAAVGDFNDWDPHAHPFKRRSNGTFSTAVVLPAGGRYAFRYLAENGRWLDEEEADGREGDNAILTT